jgi:hypothetical protein
MRNPLLNKTNLILSPAQRLPARLGTNKPHAAISPPVTAGKF